MERGEVADPQQRRMYCKIHKRYHQHQHHGCSVTQSLPSSDSSSSSSSDSEFGLSTTAIFERKAEEIKANRDLLMQKFPKEIWLPNKNDMEWCSFCLGSQMCLEIYGEKTEGEKVMYYRRLPYRRFPLLSIVLHMRQEKVILVLRFLHQWFLIKGMKNVISMWMYALLACLDDRQFNEGRDRILNSIYKDLKSYLENKCEEWQIPRVTLIMDILENYFVVDTSASESTSASENESASESEPK